MNVRDHARHRVPSHLGGSRRARPAPALLAVAAVALLLTGCQQWGPVESSYGGKVRVRATGTASIENSQRVVNSIRLEDPMADGNNVYANTKVYFYRAEKYCVDTPCPVKWHLETVIKTPEIANRVQTFTHKRALRVDADRVRLRAQACAQMGFPVPDSCSNEPAIATFSY